MVELVNGPSVDAAPLEETFAALFEESLKTENVKEGDIVRGRVIHVAKDFVTVDIGYKSEGQIPIEEFVTTDGTVTVKEGDEVEVFLESRENEHGLCVLSKEKADRLKVWDEISAACERDELIEGTISQRVKGGLSVTIRGGVKAFLPGSQVDLRPVRNLDMFLGKTFKFKVIKFNKKRGNIVLSRRVLLERERAELKESTLERLKEGQVVEGIVKNLTEYGAFIDLGGIDGLLHITDMSWGRVNHPSEMFQVGDQVRVKVLKFNAETERVSLGLKQISEDPWTHAEQKYPPGTVVRGKVVSLKDYGAFIELEEGIEGLVHVSEMSWTRRVKHPSKVVAVGDTVEAVVLDIDAKNNRISLGMKQLESNPYDALKEKYPLGAVVTGKVRNIADFGVFVELEEGIDGLVHISDMSWTQRVKHPSELFQKGDDVEAAVLNIDFLDGDKPKISLGIKQLIPDPWDRIPQEYPVGKMVEGTILKVLDFGAFIELEKGVEGLVHVSELSEDRIEDPRTVLRAGQLVKAQVINIDTTERKIGLSVRSAVRSEELSQAQGYTGGVSPQATLGDVMRSKLGDLQGLQSLQGKGQPAAAAPKKGKKARRELEEE
jgi:small subunit ribosomal protein S1